MLDDVLQKEGFKELRPMDAYGSIFRLGSARIQRNGEPAGSFKSNPIAYMKNDTEKHGRYRILFEDEFEQVLSECAKYDFSIINGVTYFGRKSTLANASKMYALAIDIDGQTDKTLGMFLGWARYPELKRIPMPNFIALSGHNIHCYWVFEEPLNLYPDTKRQLKEFKYSLIGRIWNADTSTLTSKQYQGINQGFRPFGAKTKIDGVRVRVFKSEQPFWCIEDLNQYVDESSRVDLSIRYAKSKVSITEAKEKWPEWYERRVVNKGEQGRWAVSRNLYEWYKQKVIEGATYHHRYFCIMHLATIGRRCSIYDAKKNPNPVTFEEVRQDAFALKPLLNMVNPEEPFTDADINSALECFDWDLSNQRIETVARNTALDIRRNEKRKHRDQQMHLKAARAVRDAFHPDGSWRNKKGAPSKRDLVVEYAANHPDDNYTEIAKALGISRQTVAKHLKSLDG